MSGVKAMVVLVALSGCAASQTVQRDSRPSGHWIGEIDRDGWQQKVAVDIEGGNGGYRGQLRAVKESPKQELESVEVEGNQVRFETGSLRFVGHVNGSTLSGVVTDKVGDAPVGELSATQQPERVTYSAGSEWSIPDLP